MTEVDNKYINSAWLNKDDLNETDVYDVNVNNSSSLKSSKMGGKKVKIVKNSNIYPIQSVLTSQNPTGKLPRTNLCIYRINIKPSSTPFLEYLLFKNKSDTMVFPGFNGGNIEKAHDLYESIVGEHHSAIKNYKGLIEKDGAAYMFYQYIQPTNVMLKTPYKTKSDELWWCLMDEICNWKKVLTMRVDKSVVDLFYENHELVYLYDTNYHKLEVPVVGYYGTYYKLLEFVYTFGVKESDLVSMYGPYYYFTTFNRAIKYAGWYYKGNKELNRDDVVVDELGRFDKGGVLRSAIFMKNTRVILNHPLDKVDNSEYTQSLLRDIDKREKMRVKLKMVDYDATWANDYDSVYAGRVLMDDGVRLFDYPEMVVKDNSQQVSLSIHVVDKKTLGEKWDASFQGYDVI